MAGLESLPTYEPGDRPAGKPPGMAPECWTDRVRAVTAVQRAFRKVGVTAHAELTTDGTIAGSVAFTSQARETAEGEAVSAIMRDHGLDVERREQIVDGGEEIEVVEFSDGFR